MPGKMSSGKQGRQNGGKSQAPSIGRGRSTARSPKVGSSRAADRKVGGKLDFGFPAAQARKPVKGGREKGPEQGTGPTRSGARGVRTVGVEWPVGPDGSGSGGDLDSDVIGLDGRGGVANNPGERRTSGPDITEGGSAPFASGPPAEGRNQAGKGKVGGSKRVRGDTVDHSGGDASTTGPESGFTVEANSPETMPSGKESSRRRRTQ